jgi:DNA-binding transcriptional MocR family regulator
VQHAVADVLREANNPFSEYLNYYEYLRSTYAAKRDALVRSLRKAGLTPYVPEGGIFVVADMSHVRLRKHNYSVHELSGFLSEQIEFPSSFALEPGPDGSSPVSRDWAFCR